jgi:tetratricopeptide (TPR) repeat protein
MSPRSCFLITIGAGMLFAATPSFASLSWPGDDLVALRAAKHCADAAAAAQADNNATDADVAKCTKAAKLADFDSDRAAALSNRSLLNFERADYNAAIADNTAALKLDDSLAEAVVNRGAIYAEMHRPSDAAASFSRALTLAPARAENINFYRAKIHFDRAMAREDMGDFNGAYADYAEASQLAPQWDQPKQEMARFSIARRKPIS